MVRVVLLIVLFILVARAFWRVVDNVIEAAGGRPSGGRTGGTPARGVQMVRDPVCGTFVVPDGALMIADGRTPVYFCSEKCRDQYRARSA
jgi:YHS domain-containing protein